MCSLNSIRDSAEAKLGRAIYLKYSELKLTSGRYESVSQPFSCGKSSYSLILSKATLSDSSSPAVLKINILAELVVIIRQKMEKLTDLVRKQSCIFFLIFSK